MNTPRRAGRLGVSAAACAAVSGAHSRLDDVAASAKPPAAVERHPSGTSLDPPLLRAVVDLTERNMRGYYGGAWDYHAKRDELGHADTRLVVVRGGTQLYGFAAYRLTEEEGVAVAYLYELQLETFARGMRLGTELIAEVERVARTAGVGGIMLTVHLANHSARRFYTSALGFEVSPLSPAVCAPPSTAAGCDYEIQQRFWDERARSALAKAGADARRANYLQAISTGSLRIRLVMRKGGKTASATRAPTDEADGLARPSSPTHQPAPGKRKLLMEPARLPTRRHERAEAASGDTDDAGASSDSEESVARSPKRTRRRGAEARARTQVR